MHIEKTMIELGFDFKKIISDMHIKACVKAWIKALLRTRKRRQMQALMRRVFEGSAQGIGRICTRVAKRLK